MNTNEINNAIIGKRVSVIWTGMRISGTITSLFEDEYSIGFFMDFDKPGYWGDDVYTKDLFTARKSDGWRSEDWSLLN